MHRPSARLRSSARTFAGAAILLIAQASPAFAAGPTMPWDNMLTRVLDNLSGPTARVLVLLAFVFCGIMWAFTRNEEGLKRLGQAAMGGTIALGSVALLTNLGMVAGARV